MRPGSRLSRNNRERLWRPAVANRPKTRRAGRPSRPKLRPLHLIVAWIISAAALLVAAWIVPGAAVNGFLGALAAAAVIAALNAIIPPVLAALRLPLMLLTGLVLILVADALMLLAADRITDHDLEIDSFWSALGVAFVAAAVTVVLDIVLGTNRGAIDRGRSDPRNPAQCRRRVLANQARRPHARLAQRAVVVKQAANRSTKRIARSVAPSSSETRVRMLSCPHRTLPPRRDPQQVQIQTASGYTLSASGNTSASEKILITKELCRFGTPDAPTQCEICGLGVSVATMPWSVGVSRH